MELVYLWVEEYKNIKNQGFNFSPRFTCKYDEASKELTIDKKEHVSIFPKNINITAIVGENGSGKSNLLDLLYFESSSQPYYYIFDDGKELIIQGVQIQGKYGQKIHKEKYFKEQQTLKLSCGKLSRSWASDQQNQLSLVYFSTFLESKQEKESSYKLAQKNKFNISSSYLINYYSTCEFENSNSAKNFISYHNQYGLYKSKIFENVIKILQEKAIELPIPKPKKIHISIDNSNINKLHYMEKIDYLSQQFFSAESEITLNNLSFLEKIKLSIIMNFLDYYLKHDGDLEDKLLEKVVIVDRKSADSLFEAFYIVFSVEHKKDDVENTFIEYFKMAKQLIEYLEVKAINLKDGDIIFQIEDIDKKFIGAISIYQKLVSKGLEFLHFIWSPSLSSGQENLLFQFANFYSLALERKLNDNILIFIDEGENTLHPNWQKNYIQYLISFFNKNFTQKIHIVLSSHSPFILSDLPKENVIFLDKVNEETKEKYPKLNIDGLENGNCINVSNYININPFGANIHTLLSHGFFMKDGLMGEFAKEKINKVISTLKKETLSKDEINTCKNIISIIGEPILKSTLEKMLDEKLNSNESELERLEREQKEIQEKIDRLKAKNETD